MWLVEEFEGGVGVYSVFQVCVRRAEAFSVIVGDLIQRVRGANHSCKQALRSSRNKYQTISGMGQERPEMRASTLGQVISLNLSAVTSSRDFAVARPHSS